MTVTFGLPQHEITAAVETMLTRSGLSEDEDNAVELFSRGVWSRLAEPGDGLAGWLTGALGSARALEILIARASVEQVLREIASGDAGGTAALEAAEEMQVDEAGQTPRAKTHEKLTEALTRWRTRLNSQASLRDFEIARRSELTLLTQTSPYWPQMLNELDSHTPLALWSKGDVTLLNKPALAVVGSRAATTYGETVTTELVAGVARRGYVIVSGGAYGIDGIAHRTCLATSQKTVAFLAGGVDRLYPSGHETLFHSLAEQGLLCAELPPGSSPTKWRFLQRNRLIAAVSRATLVCEAGHRSGSLNTAGHAAQLGRALGAVPGPVTSAASAGCHRLLRDYDAVCIRNVNDVLELLGEDLAMDTARILPGESSRQRRVLDALSTRKPADVERICVASGLSSTEVAETLIELELLQLAQKTNNGWKRGAVEHRS